MWRVLWIMIASVMAQPVAADSVEPRDGWAVIRTDKSFDTLMTDLRDAVAFNGFAIVTQAGPTDAAKARGIEIPENRVVGVFNNIYAVRILNLSAAAMIEAPIRLYLTEEDDGTATLSYKTPSFVFAPYLDDAPDDLGAAATELDRAFQQIATEATK